MVEKYHYFCTVLNENKHVRNAAGSRYHLISYSLSWKYACVHSGVYDARKYDFLRLIYLFIKRKLNVMKEIQGKLDAGAQALTQKRSLSEVLRMMNHNQQIRIELTSKKRLRSVRVLASRIRRLTGWTFYVTTEGNEILITKITRNRYDTAETECR